ncbi:facilitated trehalose transporter Tret1 [Diabrotica virgifera virgifera]|uniref:Major facilitator superfamily (MFS) profile domain-containing protein n=1 Tax=Diabrotica virgifera virgifera TaxID=50390 RepID=A0ABM5JPC5_DIAVI|nr:facilitated trehalose transporter Tret1 [Diabrotica virgifera virgifera]
MKVSNVCTEKFAGSEDDNLLHKGLKETSKKEEAIQRRKEILAQVFVTSAVMLSAASCGMPVGYSAVLLPQLKFMNDSMQIDDEMGSWIASIHSAATPLGSLLSGILMERCGRKLALQIASMPLIFGWFLIAFSLNHSILLLGRLIAGFSAGLTAAAGQVLIGEISEPRLRGLFSSVPLASYSFGILLVYALGSLLPWRYVAVSSTVLPVTSLLVFFFLPESPVWLTRQEKLEDAKKALVWLRGGNKIKAKQEMQHLVDRLESEKKSQTKANITTLFQPEVLKPLIIINVFNILQLLSGTYLIVFYAVDILQHIQGSQKVDHYMVAILTACVRFVFSIIGSFLLTFIGRRALALTSGLGTALSALFVATFLNQNCQGLNYVPALFVLIYVATNTLGFLILPGVLLGELFPAKIRGLSGGLTFMFFNLALFGVAKVFPLVRSVVGISGVFWIFGGTSLVACLFLYLTLPETRSKSLSEIEDYFQQKGFLWSRRNRRRQGSNEQTGSGDV